MAKTFAEQVEALVHSTFPGASLHDFGEVPGLGGKIGGCVVWDGFSALDHLERQNQLWDALKGAFELAQLRQISMIMTFTPHEMLVLDEG